jgi:succinate dehydrogenase/fumarate reductase flavoprotein subunit
MPNPNLGPVADGPFYAVAIHPGDAATVYGLKTSADAQVLRADGTAVKGLYAVGADQNSVMRGLYPGGGSTIGPGLTFGFRAAQHIAQSAKGTGSTRQGTRLPSRWAATCVRRPLSTDEICGSANSINGRTI